ncbi:MAG: tetratricopeptide repeat protein, partial [bacterium]
RAIVPPKQRAQRLVNLAQSAMKQNILDEAMDYIQQAQALAPDDPELKEMIQSLIRQYAGVKGGARPAAAAPLPAVPAAMPAAASAQPVEAPAPAAESPEDVERRIRETVEREYQQRVARETGGEAAEAVDEELKRSLQATRDQVLAHAVPAPASGGVPPLTPPEPEHYGKQAPAPEEPALAAAGAGAPASVPAEPAVKARRRVSYV